MIFNFSFERQIFIYFRPVTWISGTAPYKSKGPAFDSSIFSAEFLKWRIISRRDLVFCVLLPLFHSLCYAVFGGGAYILLITI